MKKYVLILIATLFALLTEGLSQAADGLPGKVVVTAASDQEAIELHLLLAGEESHFKLVPETLTLQAGKPYKLVIENRTDVAHALSVPEFSATVERSSAPAFPYPTGEIEVAAGETVEWYFVPTKGGRYKMGCAERTHAEAGMVGTIVVN